MDYFDKLQQKINKYKLHYANKHKRAAIKLLWWNLCQLFVFKLGSLFHKPSKTQYRLDRLSFFITGGIGDILINLNYCSYLLEFLKDEIKCIDIFVKNQTLVKELIGDSRFNIYPITEWNQNSIIYLLDFKIDRFPFIVNNHLALLEANSNPKTRKLVKLYEEFYQLNKKIVYYPPKIDALSVQYSIINKQNRMQQPDIYGYLNISGNDYKFTPSISNEKEALKEFGLLDEKFITLNRGVDGTNLHSESTKLYPLDYYNSLVKLIKSEYKEYKIVQLGVSVDRCQLIDGVDLNLVGKTSLNQLKVILKNSNLHIDGEGGMSHLRKSLSGGVSVVIFGPTSSSFYGYLSNINISSNACPVNCEWINDNWASYCINKENNHVCMKNIKPNRIFEEIKKILK
jgi:ADP-heptose:LPS heptosyltransferase